MLDEFFSLAVENPQKLLNILVVRISLLHATCPFLHSLQRPDLDPRHRPWLRATAYALPPPCPAGAQPRRTTPHSAPTLSGPFSRSRAVPGHLHAATRPSSIYRCSTVAVKNRSYFLWMSFDSQIPLKIGYYRKNNLFSTSFPLFLAGVTTKIPLFTIVTGTLKKGCRSHDGRAHVQHVPS
jgi:hypothetical protein